MSKNQNSNTNTPLKTGELTNLIGVSSKMNVVKNLY